MNADLENAYVAFLISWKTEFKTPYVSFYWGNKKE